MQPRSYKLLKAAALLIFFLAAILFVTSPIVTVASRKVQVRDKAGQVIGEAWIPHDYSTDQFIISSLMVLSGLQLWAVLNLGKAAHAKK